MKLSTGPTLLALGVLIGLVLPPLAELVRPLLSLTVFVFVTGTFLRTDPLLLRRAVGSLRTGLVLPFVAIVAMPFVAAWLLGAFGVPVAIVGGIVIALASPPSSGNAAMARMFGYGGEVPSVIILLTMLAAPLTMPLVGASVGTAIDPWALAKGLAILLVGTGGVAIVLRLTIPEQIERLGPAIDRTVVLALFVFAIATMDGVLDYALDRLGAFAALLAIAFVVNVASQGVGALLAKGDLRDRIALALTFGNRNVGLPWAVLGSALDPSTTLLFALAQLPIFVLPWVVRVVMAKRLDVRE